MLDPFVNYFRTPWRKSPLNLSVVRVILGIHLVWKVAYNQFQWTVLAERPEVIHPFNNWLIPFDGFLQYIWIEEMLVVVLLLLFIVGYRIGLTAFLAAVGIAHMSGILYMYHNGGATESFLLPMYFLLFFAVYRHEDRLSIDEFRRTNRRSLDELNRLLKTDADPTIEESHYRMDSLRWILLSVGLFYFITGYVKVFNGGILQWMSSESLARYLQEATYAAGTVHPLGMWLADQPLLTFLGAFGAITLELGFTVAIVLGLTITPFIVILLGMHTVIVLTMAPFFFDMQIFLLLFFAWDTGFAWLLPDEDLKLVYDEHCYFCARSLVLFKHLDITDAIAFYSQSDIPGRLDAPEYNYEDAMYVFDDNGTAYEGYHAFRRLLRHFRVTMPVAIMMGWPGIKRVGEDVYRYIADNRDRYFVCFEEESGGNER